MRVALVLALTLLALLWALGQAVQAPVNRGACLRDQYWRATAEGC